MSSPAALRIVRSAPAFREQLEIDTDLKSTHSLHQGVVFPFDMPAAVANYLVQRFTSREGLVLDPFAGSGSALLEAALLGRIAVGAETDPLGSRIAHAKLLPSDLTEVTLALQLLNLRRPVDLKMFRDCFTPFFDLETFREIVNLRAALQSRDDPVHRFIEFVAMSILHGHTVSFLSTYTFPQVSVSPEEQVSINRKRQQQPEYRAVAPRLLRKTAALLRDGIPSVARAHMKRHVMRRADPRDLEFVEPSSVQLLMTAPPTPFQADVRSDLWLRYWFSGTEAPTTEQFHQGSDLVDWVDYMNEVLLEGARVVTARGRAVFDLPEVRVRDREYALDEILADSVQANLSRFWEVEGILIYRKRSAKQRDCIRGGGQVPFGDSNRILVLKRRA
ncbi:MAG: DNA methyltransferase [Bdellovibrionota bacterium]|nr:MAG: DNA methyltransferase [Bdellovibrionota bacterium]